jgi:hypothetical protein
MWLAEFVNFAKEAMVSCIPRLIPVIFRNLAHINPDIRSAAVRANELLFDIIQDLPFPREASMACRAEPVTGKPSIQVPSHGLSQPPSPMSPISSTSTTSLPATNLFDYQSIVDELLIQIKTENKEANVGASKWLDMLKQKAPEEV